MFLDNNKKKSFYRSLNAILGKLAV